MAEFFVPQSQKIALFRGIFFLTLTDSHRPISLSKTATQVYLHSKCPSKNLKSKLSERPLRISATYSDGGLYWGHSLPVNELVVSIWFPFVSLRDTNSCSFKRYSLTCNPNSSAVFWRLAFSDLETRNWTNWFLGPVPSKESRSIVATADASFFSESGFMRQGPVWTHEQECHEQQWHST